ncbi:MAG: hypothetical protein UX71_C0003G0030 [Parcubacteria group bacterium GW2011_GWA1_47_10]|nr:MAG: hypothetical protein UX71_C0003G0030 [Parcubacteria group bacterium GW2011_GWA1_47_10]OHB06785.1 MAG: hypothetical protein A3A31_00565 [Candidatus Zambryskibacteria bacterium RIFCSPLOWO2_01_FULL_48_25]
MKLLVMVVLEDEIHDNKLDSTEIEIKEGDNISLEIRQAAEEMALARSKNIVSFSACVIPD